MDDGRLRVGAKLAGAAPQGIGGLQGMSPLHTLAAAFAMADVDVELPMDRLAGNLGLVLMFDGVRHNRSAAITMIGQRGLQNLIDLCRDGAERLGAVSLAGLAARRLGIRFGWRLGERRGLTLAGPRQLLQLSELSN